MVKKTKANVKSRLSSPARPLNRPKPTENASQGSVLTGRTPSRKSESSNLTPTRSSTRKSRSTAKVVVLEDSSDSDSTPPPSIFSRPSRKRRIPEKRTSRKHSNEKEVETEPDVIDLTVSQTFSPKSSRKRPKVDKRIPVNLNSFVNLCSDEEMNPQPRKKRKFSMPAADVIFISSEDESDLPGRQSVPRGPSLEHAIEAQAPKENYVAGYSAANADPVAFPFQETPYNNPDLSTPRPTPPLVSALENDSPDSVIVDITAGQNTTEISTPSLSRKLLNALYEESLLNPPLTTEESRSSSFCTTRGPELKQKFHKVVHKQAKRALLTSLIFARPMRSLGTTSRPKANATPQYRESLKAVGHIESFGEEKGSLAQDDTGPLNFQNFVPNTSSTVSPPSSTDTLRSADTGPVNAGTPDKIMDGTTCGDTSASPLMEVDGTEVGPGFPAQPKAIDDCSKDLVPSRCTGEISVEDVPPLQIVVGEAAMVKAHAVSSPHDGQADNPFAEAGSTDAEPMQNSEKQVSFAVAECVLRISTAAEGVGDIKISSCVTSIDDTHHETSSCSAAQADGPLIHPAFPDSHLSSRGPSHVADSNEGAGGTLGNSLPSETSPILQTYIDSSIFELDHSANLTFQILFTSSKILDDVSDLAISLPCYPDQLHS